MKPNKIKWIEIDIHGMPERELCTTEAGLDRAFLVKGEYSIFTAYTFSDGSGFDVPDGCTDIPQAWAIIEGF